MAEEGQREDSSILHNKEISNSENSMIETSSSVFYKALASNMVLAHFISSC